MLPFSHHTECMWSMCDLPIINRTGWWFRHVLKKKSDKNKRKSRREKRKPTPLTAATTITTTETTTTPTTTKTEVIFNLIIRFNWI